MTTISRQNALFVSDRLASKVIVDGNGCHVYQGAPNSAGYAVIMIDYKNHLAHRASYEACHGPIPNGHVVRHVCHNKMCINPSHLVIGTQQENVADNIATGRFNTGVKLAVRKPKHINMENLMGWITTVVTVCDDGCWDYPGKKLTNGYSQLQMNGKTYHLHRLVACLQHSRDYEDKSFVTRHMCSNKGCINPAHLVPGSKTENSLDSREQHGKTLLNEEKVRMILDDLSTTTMKPIQFDKYWAGQMNVPWTTISNIRYGKTWKDLRIAQ